jgi:hypothetical protein
MKRQSLGHWAWNSYNPAKALPDELRFDLLDGNEKHMGQFVFGKIRVLKGVDISTPWGPAAIDWPKGGIRITLAGRELVRLDSAFFKKTVNLKFPDGTTLTFNMKKRTSNDIVFSDGKGSVGFFEESGVLPIGHPGLKVQMTKEEIKRLPKHERPRSIESREYVQYRVMTWGTLPVKLDDLVAALTIFACFGRILDETPT